MTAHPVSSAAVQAHRRDEPLIDDDALLSLEPAGVVEEDGDRDRVDLSRAEATLLEKGLERMDPRCVEVSVGTRPQVHALGHVVPPEPERSPDDEGLDPRFDGSRRRGDPVRPATDPSGRP